jgi:hypothetical protein
MASPPHSLPLSDFSTFGFLSARLGAKRVGGRGDWALGHDAFEDNAKGISRPRVQLKIRGPFVYGFTFARVDGCDF